MAAHFARPIIERGVFSRRCILEPQGFDPTNGRGPDNRPPGAITALLVQLRCEQNGYVRPSGKNGNVEQPFRPMWDF